MSAQRRTPLCYARTLTDAPKSSPKYRSRYWDSPTTPLYPFGFGLSYTSFSIANLRISASQMKVGQSITVTADVTNTGRAAGDETLQLYIH